LQQLTEQGRQRIDELAQRYSVSADAVMTLLQSLVNGNGAVGIVCAASYKPVSAGKATLRRVATRLIKLRFQRGRTQLGQLEP
jgi:hypothetical protein